MNSYAWVFENYSGLDVTKAQMSQYIFKKKSPDAEYNIPDTPDCIPIHMSLLSE